MTLFPRGSAMDKKIGIGSLIRLKTTGRARGSTGKSFMLENGEVGMVVATDVWPDATWKDRNKYQLDGPFVKILFSEKVAVIPVKNLNTVLFETILEK